MQYKYTATNTEGKKLTGIINAPNEEDARAQLNNLGFSILEIRETEESTEGGDDMEKFEFESIDKNGKKIKGTIPAKSAMLAYKRLIQEYSFSVKYLAPLNGSVQEKQRMRDSGLQEIKNQYEIESQGGNKQEQSMQSIVESPEFIEEKTRLNQQVDSIVARIQKLLDEFAGKISPEKRSIIAGYIDKLLRIKASNNLEYIANTCKQLLEKIQEEEIFFENQEHTVERQEVVLESQKMMMELNKAIAVKKDMSTQFKAKISALEQKMAGSKMEFLLQPIRTIEEWFTPAPEMLHVETQLKALRAQKWDAIKIAIKSPKETRAIAWESVKSLREQEKEVKQKRKQIKQMRHEKNLLIKREKHLYFVEEISTFTGWLLSFYLIYYFLGHYVTTKSLPIDPILGIPFDLGDSVLFKYLLAIIFLVHSASSIKLNFFFRNQIANIALVTVTIVLSLITVFNF